MKIFYSPLVKRINPPWFNALIRGSKKHGFTEHHEITPANLSTISPNDVLLIWNRHGSQNTLALEFEKRGNHIIVLENAYLKPWDKTHISIGLGFHNNIKHSLPCLDNGERFRSLGIELKPWQYNQRGHILYCTQSKTFDQKGIGWAEYAQPSGMDTKIIHNIRKQGNRNIIFRMNPKSHDNAASLRKLGKITITNCSKTKSTTSIQDDLKGAWCTVVWTSNSATESLIEGIPVIVEGPGVFLKSACSLSINYLNNPQIGNREPLFNRMAWNQFYLHEIESGFMFDLILHNN